VAWVGLPPNPAQAGVFYFDCGFKMRAQARSNPTSHCRNPMKLIIAIIQPSKLEDVKEALSKVEVVRLTIMDVQGFGRQKGQTEIYRGREITANLLRKVQLQIAVNEEFVEPTIDAIVEGGRSGDAGQIGDGKIFVLPMDDCIRIRTGERGPEAI
jgi:nitrogen regulatory protein P-II 2